MAIRSAVIFSVLALASSLSQYVTVAATAQSQGSTIAVDTAGVASSQPGKADGAWFPARSPVLTGERSPLYRLNKSDVVELQFTFSPELNETIAIRPDGFLSLREAPAIHAEGTTIPELENSIRSAYAGVLHEPEVTVFLREFDKPYFIASGEVSRPGKYDLRSDTTVTEALAIAGGLTPLAKHSQVVLFRRTSEDQVETHLLNVKWMLRTKDLREDLHLQPGDMLYAPKNLISKIKPFMPVSGLSMYLNPTQF